MKGVLPEQLIDLDCNIILANTYHLGHRPGHELMKKAGGIHRFMNWLVCNLNCLTLSVVLGQGAC